MIPYTVIGYYKPRKLRGSVIGPAILDMIAKIGLVPLDDPEHGPQVTSIWCNVEQHAEVRRFAQASGQGKAWHQDGDLKDGSRMDHAAVLWANKTPTEFQTDQCMRVMQNISCVDCDFTGDTDTTAFPDIPHTINMLYRPAPYEIVIAHNLSCHHRTPPDAPKPPERRWFFRQRIEIPTHLEL